MSSTFIYITAQHVMRLRARRNAHGGVRSGNTAAFLPGHARRARTSTAHADPEWSILIREHAGKT